MSRTEIEFMFGCVLVAVGGIAGFFSDELLWTNIMVFGAVAIGLAAYEKGGR